MVKLVSWCKHAQWVLFRFLDKTTAEVKSAIYHSDVDDTAESSSDEDGPQEIPVVKESSTPGERPHGSKKFIKMVDRIAESKFFQAAAENRYIKKAMEGKTHYILLHTFFYFCLTD